MSCRDMSPEQTDLETVYPMQGGEPNPENSSAMHARLADGSVVNAGMHSMSGSSSTRVGGNPPASTNCFITSDVNPEAVSAPLPRGGYGCTTNVEE